MQEYLAVIAPALAAALAALAAWLKAKPGKDQMDRIEATLRTLANTGVEINRAGNTTAMGLLELRQEVHAHFEEDKSNFRDIRTRLEALHNT